MNKNDIPFSSKKVKVVSLFDGMACGMIAMINAGLNVESYEAFEIDKFAIATSQHNFPDINHNGDVFDADFTKYKNIDYVIGGSPCTYWSIAQKNNRETEASGMGWELFCQYVRAVKEIKPKFFIYENNKSMSQAIKDSISSTFGFEPICINSALLSAQNRQRLYWVGKLLDDGTYERVNIEQPEDKGILLKDILESGCDLMSNDKSYAYTTRCSSAIPEDTIHRHRHSMVAEPINQSVRIPEYGSIDKSRPIRASYCHKGSGEGSLKTEAFPNNPNKQVSDYIAEPVNMTTDEKSKCLRASCYKDGIRNMICNDIDRRTCIAEPIRVGCMPSPDGTIKNGQGNRIYSVDGKSISQTANGGGIGNKTGLYSINCESAYAIPYEYNEEGKPIKATSMADGKLYNVYEVKDGLIKIKSKHYPIKLKDGFYIIRKLTVRECMRLQTVPEWYKFPVSNTQAYKMLGNGWTCDVITHLINATLNCTKIK